jgi:hypothetical protein
MRFSSGAFRLCGTLFATTVLVAGFSMSASQAGERWDAFVDDLPSMPRVSVPDIPMPRVYVPDIRFRWHEYGEPVAVQPPVFVPATPVAAHPSDRFGASALSSSEVARALRANGYSMLGQVSRRGAVYTAAVLNPRGDDGLAVIDAQTGAIIRFIPALAMNARLNDQLGVMYGPPGPPPVAPDVRRAPKPAPRVVKRDAQPKVPAPKTADRAPLNAPPVAQTKPADAHAEMKPAQAPAPAPQPEAKPATPELLPTQQMPDVQALD